MAQPAVRPGAALRSVRRLRRPFDTVRVRLLTVITLCVLPLAILSSVLAWHNYVGTIGSAYSRARTIAETLKGQSDQQIADTSRLLETLSEQPELQDPARCAALLQLVMRLQASRLLQLDLMTLDGRPLCGDGPSSVPMQQTPKSLAGAPVALHPLLTGFGGHHQPALRFLLPTTGPSGPALLMAVTPLGARPSDLAGIDERLGNDDGSSTTVFLVGPDGHRYPLCAQCREAGSRSPLDIKLNPADGRFEQTHLVDGVGLLVFTQPTAEEQRALALFLGRVSVVALFLVLGLLAVMIGAALLITRPLRDITAAVTGWRREGGFSPASSRSAPVELRKLSRAFADATRSLAAHEDRLEKAEIKQALLIKEIHHRVKNNLQIIASLLNLQANRIRHEGARAEFAAARDRVRALATLHRHLYSEGELHTLNMRSFLEELCGQLFQAIGEKEGRRITLSIDAPEIVMSTDQAVPLALVVTEAVSNAIKYAFPGGRSGTVSVHLIESQPHIARLVIEDNGIGIPAGRAETETGIRDGLGIQLIRGFARQLGATLDVETGADGHGTRYVLLVPLQPEVAPVPEPAAD